MHAARPKTVKRTTVMMPAFVASFMVWEERGRDKFEGWVMGG